MDSFPFSVPQEEAAPEKRKAPGALAAVLLILTALALGYLGWVLPSAGGSLAVPTLIVFGAGIIATGAWWFVTHDPIVVMLTVVIALAGSIWTFGFSIPASLTWGSDATSQAQAILSRLGSSPENVNGVVPNHGCSIMKSGSVGLIDAPYRECPTFTPEGHFVIFTSVGDTGRGLGYTDRGADTFLDECNRHLVGKWWMFTAETSDLGGCPIGYQFHGGP